MRIKHYFSLLKRFLLQESVKSGFIPFGSLLLKRWRTCSHCFWRRAGGEVRPAIKQLPNDLIINERSQLC
jgi:hypothetical protein